MQMKISSPLRGVSVTACKTLANYLKTVRHLWNCLRGTIRISGSEFNVPTALHVALV
jgi:hypothetical protein